MKYIISKQIDVDAPLFYIYKILTKFENWPLWTKSVKKITRIYGNSFSVGSRYRVLQPGLLPAVWTVISVDEGSSFTWEQKFPGLRMTAIHELIPELSGLVTVQLTVVYEGVLAGPVYWLTAPLSQRYLTLELHGIKHECEKD